MLNLFAIPVLFAIGIFWGGYALSQLWLWFVVPLGAPAITFAHAAGLQLTFLLFTASRGVDRDKFDATTSLVKSLLVPALSLGFGRIIQWLMLHA